MFIKIFAVRSRNEYHERMDEKFVAKCVKLNGGFHYVARCHKNTFTTYSTHRVQLAYKAEHVVI